MDIINEIKAFYEQYTNNLKYYHEIEQALINTPCDSQEWRALLQKKCSYTREMYLYNSSTYQKVLQPFIDNPKTLNMEIVEELLIQIYKIYNNKQYDQYLTTNVLNAIFTFLENNPSLEHEIIAHHLYGWYIQNLNTEKYIKIATSHYKQICDQYQLLYTTKYPQIRHAIIAAFYNYIVREVEFIDTADYENVAILFKQTHDLYHDSKIRAMFNDSFHFDHYYHVLQQRIAIHYRKFKEHCSEEGYKFVKAECYRYIYDILDKHQAGEYLEVDDFIAYVNFQLVNKKINKDEYISLCWQYLANIEKPENCTTDEFLRSDYLNVTNMIGPNLISLISKLDNPNEEQLAIKESLLDTITKIYACIPDSTQYTFFIDRIIYRTFLAIIPHLEPNYCLKWINQFIVNRQISTSIHSHMVSKIAGILIDYIIENKPELIIDKLNINARDILLGSNQIKLFTRNSGLIHDIGKIRLSSIINCDYRRLSDEEFDALTEHPSFGAEIVKGNKELSTFATSIEGHHKFYNNIGGYPKHFNRDEHKTTLLLDILAISDSLDAATDMYGRNYHVTKNVDTVIQEFIDDNGKHYNPELVELISSDENLINTLRIACSEAGRRDTIQVIYSLKQNQSKQKAS